MNNEEVTKPQKIKESDALYDMEESQKRIAPKNQNAIMKHTTKEEAP